MGLNDWRQRVMVATALVGTFVGAVLGGPFGDRLGRKRALAVIGALYLVSAVGSALTASWGAYVSNFLLQGAGWRWMLGVEAVFLGLAFMLPESPRWLAIRNVPAVNERILTPQMRFSVLLAIAFAVFNQVSGINAIIYYAPRIFSLSGLSESAGFLATMGVGGVNFLFTLLGMRFIDSAGRRQLMTVGSYGLIATLAGVAACFHFGIGGALVPVLLFAYIAFFALSQGAVIWVFLAEIFPDRVRARGQSIGSATHWLMATVIAFIFPGLTAAIGPAATFGFFALAMVLQLVWVRRVMPETKGVSLGELQTRLQR